ncbi:hypothetical protein HOM98_04815 [Candidatus Peregrinibacteria bacterium]|jgi:hypothetical protein|nr:hypothetical protein [Candidatus Peregrinibacteria bacterium]MBT7484062.1 hypothetical protein [Candidatus Peregrinibacteria bacterium]
MGGDKPKNSDEEGVVEVSVDDITILPLREMPRSLVHLPRRFAGITEAEREFAASIISGTVRACRIQLTGRERMGTPHEIIDVISEENHAQAEFYRKEELRRQEVIANPTIVREKIQAGGRFMGYGGDRRGRQVVWRHEDLELVTLHLNDIPEGSPESRDQDPSIVIIDSGLELNIFAELFRRQLALPEDERDTTEVLWEKARIMTKRISLTNLAYVQAIQDSAIKGPQPDRKIDVCLMSEVIEGDEEFQRVFKGLEGMLRKESPNYNPVFAQKVWECVPDFIKKKVGGPSKNLEFYDDITNSENNTDRADKAFYILRYAAHEAAAILTVFRGGIKIGSKTQEASLPGEDKYDELAQYTLENHGPELGLDPEPVLRFERLDANELKTRGSAVYRVGGYTHDPPEGARSLLTTDEFWGGAVKAFQHIHRTWDIYDNFLERIGQEPRLTPQGLEEIHQREVIRIMCEVVKVFEKIPALEYLFKRTGALEFADKFLNEKDTEGLLDQMAPAESEPIIPFTCKRRPDESDERFFIRYISRLLGGVKGPITALNQVEGEEEQPLNEGSEYLYRMLHDISTQLYEKVGGDPKDLSFADDHWRKTSYLAVLEDAAREGLIRQEQLDVILRQPTVPGLYPYWKTPYVSWCRQAFGAGPARIDWEEKIRDLEEPPESSPYS